MNFNIKKIIIPIITLIALSINSATTAQSIPINNLKDSDAYRLIEETNDINTFLSKNHKTMGNLRLIERALITSQPLEDNCYNIYFGNGFFEYNPTEGENCLVIMIFQGKYQGAFKISEIKLQEKKYNEAAIFYGIGKTLTLDDDSSIRNRILLNISQEEFNVAYERGLQIGQNINFFENNIIKKDWKNLPIEYTIKPNKTNEKEMIANELIRMELYNDFIDFMNQFETSGSNILLLSQAKNNNMDRLSEYCFKQKILSISYNCLQNIYQKTKNEMALNRFVYLIFTQRDELNIDMNDIYTMIGFNSNDFLSNRLLINSISDNNNSSNVEEILFYYNMGRIKSINLKKENKNE